jgi:hypothetical protein
MTDEFYGRWLAEHRELLPPPTLTDHIMDQVVELERLRQSIWWLRLVQRVEHSRARRWVVCGAALAVGSLPFIFLAHVAQFVTF